MLPRYKAHWQLSTHFYHVLVASAPQYLFLELLSKLKLIEYYQPQLRQGPKMSQKLSDRDVGIISGPFVPRAYES